MSEQELIQKLDILIEFFENYNEMLSIMEKNVQREYTMPLAA